MRRAGYKEGSCATTERELFLRSETAVQAVEACNHCPVLDRCHQNLATIALQIASPMPVVVAGEVVQTSVERPINYHTLPELPYDGKQGLDLLRQGLLGDNLLPSTLINPAVDALIQAYDAQDTLHLREHMGDLYVPSWRILANALKKYDYHSRTILADYQKVFPIADCFFNDMMALSSMGFARLHVRRLAIRHSPDEYRELFAKYQDNPDLTPTRIRQLALVDIHYPDCAVQDYLLRLQLVAAHYKEVPRPILRTICASHKGANVTHAIEKWQETYDSIRQEPYYSTFPDWLVRYAAGVSPKRRKSQISKWNLFFRTRVESLDAGWQEKNARSRHEAIASNTHIDPEDHVLREEAISEVMGLLCTLPLIEQQAVAYTYGLEIFLDVELDLHILRTQLKTDNVEQHVKEHILPKLRRHMP